MKRQIYLDVETTGLNRNNRDRIIEIAALEAIDNKLTGNNLHMFFNPTIPISLEAQAIHGITLAELEDKPLFKDHANHIAEFIFSAHEIIAHNNTFDLNFLLYECFLANSNFSTANYRQQYNTILTCTLKVSRGLFKEKGLKHNLDTVCKRLNVDLTNRNKHGALMDAKLCYHVHQKLRRITPFSPVFLRNT